MQQQQLQRQKTTMSKADNRRMDKNEATTTTCESLKEKCQPRSSSAHESRASQESAMRSVTFDPHTTRPTRTAKGSAHELNMPSREERLRKNEETRLKRAQELAMQPPQPWSKEQLERFRKYSKEIVKRAEKVLFNTQFFFAQKI